MIITPSILTSTAEDAFTQIQKLSPYFNYFQIDIADGRFVENTTVSLKELREYIHNNPTSPVLSTNHFDFHLMVEDYQNNLRILQELQSVVSIKNVFIHIKLLPDYDALKIAYPYFAIGLVFNPEDDVHFYSTKYEYNRVDLVQVMSVTPGKQGNAFTPDSLHKLEQLRSDGYKSRIFLDGGINAQTLPVILAQQFPPDGIGPGSYLSKAENIHKRVEELKQLCITAGISPILKV
jgi:pentose-5-phosphate-3-epimerase